MKDKKMTAEINKSEIQELDAMISARVREVSLPIPDPVEERVNAAIRQVRGKKARFAANDPLWLRVFVPAAAAVVLIAVLFIFRPLLTDTAPTDSSLPISEIKTQFELSDKNIKILWVQKKDFQLPRSAGEHKK